MKTGRIYYLDNIRWFVIVLVVALHTAVTYSGIGSWYYDESTGVDTVSSIFFLLFQVITQAFSMGLLFLIAGFFVRQSLDRKGSRRFIFDRFFRLGVPVLLYALLINPLNHYMLRSFLGVDNAVFLSPKDYYLSLQLIGGTGPLWFALALLIFSISYLAYQRVFPRKHTEREIPNNTRIWLFIAVVSLITFLVRIIQPIGTDIFNMQLCFFTQYIAFFTVGTIAARENWLSQVSLQQAKNWLRIAFAVTIIYIPLLMILGGAADGRFDDYSGGWHIQAFLLAAWEQFFAVAISIGLLGYFKDRFNTQGNAAKFLSDNSFSVYVWHAPILILTSLLLKDFALYPLLKFFIVLAIALVLCFGLSQFFFRKTPLLRNIL